MRFFTFFILLVMFFGACKSPKESLVNSNNKPFDRDSFINPIIPGFNPDPSICRVGEDYYLVTSTFEYFPGVPIYHSKDLVTWQLIGHVLNRPEQLDLIGVQSTAGIYAPTIRHHNGVFYMVTTMVANNRTDRKKGNFICTSKNINGPWSNPIWIEDAPGIDPSLFFDDDGKVYFSGNRPAPNLIQTQHKQIWIQELDLNTFKLKGEIGIHDAQKYLQDSTIIGNAVAMEASHIYKKNGSYYLMVAHGGTGMTHAVSIFKSNSPLGPWQDNPNNPILTHRKNTMSGINCTGHADLIQTHNGEWWITYLAVRAIGNKNNLMGRETFLSPVDWSGEWPIINTNGKDDVIAFNTKRPNLPKQTVKDKYYFFDDFNSKKLGLEWTMIRNPLQNWYSLTNKKGYISLNLLKDEIEQSAHPVFLGKRVVDQKIEASTLIEFNPVDKDCAGLVLLRGHEAEWSIVKEVVDTSYFISAYYNKDKMASVEILDKTKPTYLKIEINNFEADFLYSENGDNWNHVAAADINAVGFPKDGRFTGSFIGMYASSRGKLSTNKAHFDFFEMKKLSKNNR